MFDFSDNDNYRVKTDIEANGRYIINKKKIKVLTYKSGYSLENIRKKLNKVIKPSLDVIEEMDFEDDNNDESSLFKHDYLKKIIGMIDSENDDRFNLIKNYPIQI